MDHREDATRYRRPAKTQVYAVKADRWRVAIKVKAAAYGLEPADRDVWSEVGTTALIAMCGEEERLVLLEEIE